MFKIIRNLFSWLNRNHLIENGIIPSDNGGVALTSSSIYENTPMAKGIALYANSLSKIRYDVVTYEPNNAKSYNKKHPAYKVLNSRFNSYTKSIDGIFQICSDSFYFGNGYGLIVRTPGNLEVWNLPWYQVEPILTPYSDGTFTLDYMVHIDPVNGVDLHVHNTEMLHLAWNTRSDERGIIGTGALKTYARHIGLDLNITEFQNKYFSNAGTPGVVIEYPTTFKSVEEKAIYQKGIDQQISGKNGWFRSLILQNGAKADTLKIDMQASQLIESQNQNIVSISHILNLPESELGGKQSQSYGSLEMDFDKLLSFSLDPIICRFEQEVSTKLLKQSEIDAGNIEIVGNRDDLLKGDSTNKEESVKAKWDAGLISLQEARIELGYSSELDPTHRWVQSVQHIATPTPATPEPPQATPTPAPATDSQSIVRSLLKANLERIQARLVKAKPSSLVALAEHEQIIRSSFPMCDQWVTDFLANLGTELENILPEQREMAIENAIRKIEDEICK